MFLPILFMSSFSLEDLRFVFIMMACAIGLSMFLFIRLPIPKSE